MDKTLGALLHPGLPEGDGRGGVTADQIDGVICCDSHIAGGSGGPRRSGRPGPTSPRPTIRSGGSLWSTRSGSSRRWGLTNVKFAPTGLPTISEMVGMAAQAVGDGVCSTCLVIYPTGNLEGRYRRGGENADDYARGARQWTAPWGNHGGNDFINMFPHGSTA
jgi:hypothetical protein